MFGSLEVVLLRSKKHEYDSPTSSSRSRGHKGRTPAYALRSTIGGEFWTKTGRGAR
jgi:hypothetical protein